MTKWLVVVCSLGLLVGCGDDAAKPAGAGTGGTVGTPDGGGVPDVAAGTGGAGGTTPAGTGGTTPVGTGGTTPVGTGGTAPDAAADAPGDTGGGTPSSMMITAAAGGTLSAGGASLLVPGGVLAADKTLTVTVRPKTAGDPGSASILGDVFEFGPDGTTFPVPVALTLPLPSAVPADKKAVVAWLEVSSGQWFPVASTATADKVTGQITHFTSFAVLVLAKDEVCPYAGSCGGSLDGTWKYSQTCLKPEEKEAFKCGTAGSVMMRNEYLVNGTVTIGGGKYTADQMITATGTLFYTAACMAVLRESMPTLDCATLQAAWRKENVLPGKPENPWICAGTPAQGCACTLTNGATVKTMGTATVEGQKVTFTQEGKPAKPADDFCVKGNVLSVKSSDGDVYTAIKQ